MKIISRYAPGLGCWKKSLRSTWGTRLGPDRLIGKDHPHLHQQMETEKKEQTLTNRNISREYCLNLATTIRITKAILTN